MTSRSRLAGVAAAVLAVALSGCEPAPRWDNALLTPNAADTAGGDAKSSVPVFSPDGTKVAFESSAADLVPGGAPRREVYVRDLTTGTTTLASVSSVGAPANQDVSGALFSPDGTELAFYSMASNLVPGDTNGTYDAFLHDLVTGSTTLLSVNAAGTGAANQDSFPVAFSPDGTNVALRSFATDMVPLDQYPDFRDGLFVRDLTTDTTQLVDWGPGYGFGFVTFGPGGDEIVFDTWNDVPPFGSSRGGRDVVIADLSTGETTLVSVDATGTASGNGGSFHPVLSPDGSKVAFESLANDLGPADGTSCADGPGVNVLDTRCRDIYVRDLAAGTTTLVSVNGAGDGGGNDASWNPTFSPDGTQILFESYANDLGPTDADRPGDGAFSDPDGDVYVRDLVAGTTTLVSADASGTDSGNAWSMDPQFSADGRRVAFQSVASDLVPAQTQFDFNIFVRDLATATTSWVSTNRAGDDAANGQSTDPVWRPGAQALAFVSDATDLVDHPFAFANPEQIYLATLPEADLSATLGAEPASVARGTDVVYTVTVANAGPDAAAGVNAGLLLPEGTAFVDAATSTGSCTDPTVAQPRSVVCALGDVADGDTVEITVTAHVTAPAGSSLTALAVVTGPTFDPTPTDHSATRAVAVVG
jgi:uncharacterized repeat protein (TIGR01451 family)